MSQLLEPTTLSVQGMTCSSCVNSVETPLPPNGPLWPAVFEKLPPASRTMMSNAAISHRASDGSIATSTAPSATNMCDQKSPIPRVLHAPASIFWNGSRRSPQPTKSEYEIDALARVETAIRDALATHRTSDGLVGEEFGSDKGSSGRYWVIDPIDGTKNFMRGVPTWATLIALVQVDAAGTEEVVVGIASAPALARRWAAAKGHGATVRFNAGNVDYEIGDSSDDDFAYSETKSDFQAHSLATNEKKISVSKVSTLADASISYSDFVGWGDRLEPFQKMLAGAWRTRGIGDFWSHMLVAATTITS